MDDGVSVMAGIQKISLQNPNDDFCIDFVIVMHDYVPGFRHLLQRLKEFQSIVWSLFLLVPGFHFIKILTACNETAMAETAYQSGEFGVGASQIHIMPQLVEQWCVRDSRLIGIDLPGMHIEEVCSLFFQHGCHAQSKQR